MPAAITWPARVPVLFDPPTDRTLFRVAETSPDWGPLDANPVTGARFSLRGTHAMFYVADSIEGALWEALLRYTKVGAKGVCEVPVAKLKGQHLARVRMVRDNVKVLRLTRPELLHIFPDGDGPEVETISQLIATPKHALTHPAAELLRETLKGLNPPLEMPMLSWRSRQFPEATVYLAYRPLVDATYWELEDAAVPLDTPVGYTMIQAALARHGFHWTPKGGMPKHFVRDDTE